MSAGPLQGITVVDLSAVVSGPMAAGLLADQGAAVTKVESPQGDLTRLIGPVKGDITPTFAALNRGKRSIVLDLKLAPARAVLRQLLARADVLIENFRPGAMARLGFSYDEVAAFNPGIVYLSISGFGQSGPHAHVRVYDPVIQAASGFADAHPNQLSGEPQLLQTVMCDKITALTAAQAVTAALLSRERGGGERRGQKIELAMLDANVAFLWPEAFYNHAFLDDVLPAVPEFGANQKLWRCADGWLTLITPYTEEFVAMCRVFGVPELIDDPRFATLVTRRQNQVPLRERLEPIVASRSVDEWVAALVAAGVSAGRFNSKARLADDPQVRHNALLHEVAYPGIGRLRTPRAAAQFIGMPWDASRLAPHLGQHSRELLVELGHDGPGIEALLAAGAVR